MSYSETAMRFVADTRWDGELPEATHIGVVGIQGEGPYAKIWLKVQAATVLQARFQTYSCPAARASCAVLCWAIEGKPLEVCSQLNAEDLTILLGGLPEGKGHLPDLAINALRGALGS